MRVIGIDPGANGAIFVLDNGRPGECFIVPKIGNMFDILGLVHILRSLITLDCHVYIEDVHAVFGSAAGATFSFGETVGAIKASVIALGFRYTLVQPKKWQAVSFAGVPEIRKPDTIDKNGKPKKGRVDTKAMALIASKRLFPAVDTRASVRCKNSHDGIVDALLIAYYGATHR